MLPKFEWDYRPKKKRDLEYWRGVAQIVGPLIATLALILSTATLYLTRKDINNERRAKILIGEASLERPIDEGVVPQFTTTLKNVGKTPATNIKTIVYFFEDKPQIPTAQITSGLARLDLWRTPTDFVSIPGGVDAGLFFDPHAIASAAAVEAYRTGKSTMYFRAIVQYEDTYGKTHHSRACYLYTTNPLVTSHLLTCTAGFDSD